LPGTTSSGTRCGDEEQVHGDVDAGCGDPGDRQPAAEDCIAGAMSTTALASIIPTIAVTSSAGDLEVPITAGQGRRSAR